jgi:hypothetical protein
VEGRSLFNRPDRLWGVTPPAETLDMVGQTTIGPWQMTDWNMREHYGAPYGIRRDWSLAELVAYCLEHPGVQARMIADYMQAAYSRWGRRSPHGIQHYFWLEAFLKGEIGQGAWDAPVLVLPDAAGRWDVTPDAMRRTGFYAKQVVMGHGHNPHGLLFWLWTAGDEPGIRAVLVAWRDQRRWAWDETTKAPVETADPGGFAIRPEDVRQCPCHPEFRDAVRRVAEEVLQ